MLAPASFDIIIERGIGYGPVVVTCYDAVPPPDGAGVVVNLTGFIPHAHARAKRDGPLLHDLAPILLDAIAGKVQIPQLTDEQTLAFAVLNGFWSLVLENASGLWLPPTVAGRFVVTPSVTRNES